MAYILSVFRAVRPFAMAVLKTSVGRKAYQGFESLSLRHQWLSAIWLEHTQYGIRTRRTRRANARHETRRKRIFHCSMHVQD